MSTSRETPCIYTRVCVCVCVHTHARISSPRYGTVYFKTSQEKWFWKQKAKNIKKTKNFQKCAPINTECDAQKQHSQSEMRVISIYRLSQSEIRLIKLLKKELPCLIRKVQWSQVNVKNVANIKKNGQNLNQGLHQRSKVSALRHGQKRSMQVLTVTLTKPFRLDFENIKVNA